MSSKINLNQESSKIQQKKIGLKRCQEVVSLVKTLIRKKIIIPYTKKECNISKSKKKSINIYKINKVYLIKMSYSILCLFVIFILNFLSVFNVNNRILDFFSDADKQAGFIGNSTSWVDLAGRLLKSIFKDKKSIPKVYTVRVAYFQNPFINLLLFGEYSPKLINGKINYKNLIMPTKIKLFYFSTFSYLIFQQLINYIDGRYSLSKNDIESKEFIDILLIIFLAFSFFKDLHFYLLIFRATQDFLQLFSWLFVLILSKIFVFLLLNLNNKIGSVSSMGLLCFVDLVYLLIEIWYFQTLRFFLLLLLAFIFLFLMDKFIYLKLYAYNFQNIFSRILSLKNLKKSEMKFYIRFLGHTSEQSFLVNNIVRSLIMYIAGTFGNLTLSNFTQNLISLFLSMLFGFINYWMNMSPYKLKQLAFNRNLEINEKRHNLFWLFTQIVFVGIADQYVKILFSIFFNNIAIRSQMSDYYIYHDFGNQIVLILTLLIKTMYDSYNNYIFYHTKITLA